MPNWKNNDVQENGTKTQILYNNTIVNQLKRI